ncbi:MAG: hypothetical protein R3192_04580 [Woeseiaceae bacterium]|nr:hypothetical protein [Woeseiaceae bacterium]
MKGVSVKFAVLGISLLFAGNTYADDDFWVGVKAGTLGLGVEGSWRPIPWLDFRAGANMFDYDDSGSQAGINYDAALALETFFATANLRFPMSPFRLTVGAFSNGNELELVSQDANAYFIGDDPIPYLPSEVGTLSSTTSFDSTAPYLGAGFDFSIANRFGIALDFGVLWQGEPSVTLTSDGTLATDPSALGDQFRSALEVERQQLEDEVKDFKAYPVVSLGFNFNF